MTKLAAILGLILSSAVALAQATSGLPSPSSVSLVQNAGTTGTTLFTLTKLTGAPSTAVIASTSDTSGVVGVTVAGAGTTAQAVVQLNGIVYLVFDGATTAGDYVQISSTVAGNGHDTGSASCPTSGQVVGRVLSTNASGGTYQINLGSNGCGSGGGGGVTSLNSLTGGLNITAGTGITVTPSGSNIQISGSPFGYPSGSRSVWIGNSVFTNNGYTTIAIASGSCTTGTCTYTTSTPHNYQAGQSIGMSGFSNSCSNINTTVASTADVYHYVVSGTTCGTTSLATGNSNEITSSVSCTSNVCTITSGNSFSVADDVMINTGFSPSCMAGHVYKAQSGTSSSQIVVDTTGWGACGTTTGTGGIYWDADYSIPGYSCKNEPWFQNLAACDNRAIGGYNLSDLVSNYTSVFHPIVAAAVLAAGSNPVPVFIYANNGSSSALAADKSQWQSLAASLHAEGANVRVIPFTIPTAPCSDPNGIGHTGIALTYQLESSWLLTQTSPDQAPATGQYFDHVISLSGVWNPGMCNSDNIHPNNVGVKNIADKANSEAGLQGVGINQDSCPVGSACYQSGPKYVTDGTNTYSTQWFNGNLNEGTGDPLVTGNYTLVGGVRGGYTTVRGSGCYTWMSDNNPLTSTTDTYLCKNGAGEVDFGTGAGNHAGGASLTFLDMQATTAPTGSCSTLGRWEWAKDGTSAWCNGTTWQSGTVSTAFSAISSGVNSSAAMQVSSGGKLTVDGGTFFRGTVNAQSGTTYTFVAADNGELTTFNNVSAQAVTLPQATTTGFTAGASFDVQVLGAGTVTITPTTSTINGNTSLTLTVGQGAHIVSDGANYSAQLWVSTTGSGGDTITSPQSTLNVGGTSTNTTLDVNPVATVVDTSTPVTVSTTKPYEIHFNENATAATAVTYNLPTAAAGKQFCFSNANNGSAANTGILTIATSASGQFIVFTDGTLSATGGNVTSGGAAADAACVVGIDSTHWMLYVQVGTWTKH